MKPLEGITVVDLSTFVAAPVCGRFLADMGARVIKIEPAAGDHWRAAGIGYMNKRASALANPIFDIYNSGKDMISINLKTAEGMAIMHQLLAKADVFITNNRPAALLRLGLHYTQLREKYPRLVYALLLGYGEKGPDADAPAFDTTAFWSRSGFMRDMGVDGPEYQPVAPASGVGDSVAGTNLAMQVLGALLGREKTGKGQVVKASIVHVGAFAMGTMTIHTQRPHGKIYPAPRHEHNLPGGAYGCADGEWIYIGLGDRKKTVPALYKMIGHPDLGEDPRFQPGQIRKNMEAYYTVFKEALLKKPSDYWTAQAKELDIPIVRMRHFADVSEDEQAWANGYVEKMVYSTGNENVVPTSPIEMESVGAVKTQPTKPVGCDTAKILSELGFTPEEIQNLHNDGIVLAAE